MSLVDGVGEGGSHTAHLTAAAPEPLAVVTVAAAAGVLAGAGGRTLLRRLRRGTRVPPPWCEVVVAVLWAVTGAAWAAGLLPAGWLPVLLALGWFAATAGAVDLRRGRLPNALTVPAAPAALVLLLPVGPAAVVQGAVGAVVALVVHAGVHLVDRRAVGAGDVKLAAPLGAVLAAVGWPALPLAAVLAAVLTGAFAVGRAAGSARCDGPPGPRVRWDPATPAAAPWEVAVRDGPGPRTTPGRRLVGRPVPHGPSMLAATWAVTTALLALGAGGGAEVG